MPSVTATQVSSLRYRTGVSIGACKDALEEAKGDEEKAIEILRKRGLAQAAKKAGRDQTEGRLFLVEGDGKAAVVKIACETDFVAKNDTLNEIGTLLAQKMLSDGLDAAKEEAASKIPELINKLGENISFEEEAHAIEAPVIGAYLHSNGKIAVLVGLDTGTPQQARDVAMHATAMSPQFISPDDVSDDLVNKEKEIWKTQLEKEGKPADIMEKILLGKEKKFRGEVALISQDFVKDPGKTVGEYLGEAKVTSYVRVEV